MGIEKLSLWPGRKKKLNVVLNLSVADSENGVVFSYDLHSATFYPFSSGVLLIIMNKKRYVPDVFDDPRRYIRYFKETRKVILNMYFQACSSNSPWYTTSRLLCFFNAFLQYVASFDALKKSCNHKCHIWMVFFLHEQMQHVYSCYPFENSCSHKCCIWMVSSLYELT